MQSYRFKNGVNGHELLMLMTKVLPSRVIFCRGSNPQIAFADFDVLQNGLQGPEFISKGAWRGCLHALRAAGHLSEPDDAISGYMLFAADTPMIGLDPHPAYAPNPEGARDAAGWFEAYNCFKSLEDAKREAIDFIEGADEDEAFIDIDEPDVAMACRVYPDGSVSILDFSSPDPQNDEIACHSVDGMYQKAFGMDVPVVSGKQSTHDVEVI